MSRKPLIKAAYLTAGIISVGVGVIGIFLPIMPTVPFLILAAFCFARSNPAWEQRLLDHPIYGPSLRDWRERGIVSRKGKIAATVAFGASVVFGLIMLTMPWVLIPPVIAIICLTWLWTRPES